MLSKFITILAAASATLAITPPGFEPGTDSTLVVTYGNASAEGGNVLERLDTQSVPKVGTQSRLEGSSFAVLMVDLDIPTDSPPATNTLLHWLQIGYVQDTVPVSVNTDSGTANRSAFLFKQPSESPGTAAEYIAPNPPARIPLSHRYTQILIDTSDATPENLGVLQDAAETRLGFDVLDVLTKAGLADKVLAANYFNVTNPGPVESSTNSTSNSTTTDSTEESPSATTPPSAASMQTASGMLLSVALAGVMFLTL